MATDKTAAQPNEITAKVINVQELQGRYIVTTDVRFEARDKDGKPTDRDTFSKGARCLLSKAGALGIIATAKAGGRPEKADGITTFICAYYIGAEIKFTRVLRPIGTPDPITGVPTSVEMYDTEIKVVKPNNEQPLPEFRMQCLQAIKMQKPQQTVNPFTVD